MEVEVDVVVEGIEVVVVADAEAGFDGTGSALGRAATSVITRITASAAAGTSSSAGRDRFMAGFYG